MSMDKNLNFTEDTSPIISSILKEYNIEESDDDIVKKVSENKPLYGEVIFGAIKKILDKEQKELLYSFLAEQLNIDEKTAIQVYKSINEKLVPLVKIEVRPTDNKAKAKIDKAIPQEKKTNIVSSKEILNKKPDNYREPIN